MKNPIYLQVYSETYRSVLIFLGKKLKFNDTCKLTNLFALCLRKMKFNKAALTSRILANYRCCERCVYRILALVIEEIKISILSHN